MDGPDAKHEASSSSTRTVLAVLYDRVLRHRPEDPAWEGRDRFLLSKGHGPAAFYTTLARHGYFPESWLDGFMTAGGRLGGHPDRHLVPGVEVSTGSLGHGLPMAVGVALALRAKGLDEPRTFVLTGDAELNEGSCWEAIMTAPRLALDRLTLIVVDNRSSTIPMTHLTGALEAFGWDAVRVAAHHADALAVALARASDRPTAVVCDA
jgi:transketolase